MISLLRGLVNWLAFLVVKRHIKVNIGRSSRLRWRGLLGQSAGQLMVGNECIINCKFGFDGPFGSVEIGDRCYIGTSHLVCRQRIAIGNDVIISWGVTVIDHDSHSLYWERRSTDVLEWAQGRKDWSHVSVRPVVIRDRVWIGFGATILKGVEIGEGAVIGAGAVVTKNVAAYTVVAGNPASPVKSIKHKVDDVV
jgi:acetyltransferase-like isoleucine patch superfamily enzyme